jgi:hypothetical protein
MAFGNQHSPPSLKIQTVANYIKFQVKKAKELKEAKHDDCVVSLYCHSRSSYSVKTVEYRSVMPNWWYQRLRSYETAKFDGEAADWEIYIIYIFNWKVLGAAFVDPLKSIVSERFLKSLQDIAVKMGIATWIWLVHSRKLRLGKLLLEHYLLQDRKNPAWPEILDKIGMDSIGCKLLASKEMNCHKFGDEILRCGLPSRGSLPVKWDVKSRLTGVVVGRLHMNIAKLLVGELVFYYKIPIQDNFASHAFIPVDLNSKVFHNKTAWNVKEDELVSLGPDRPIKLSGISDAKVLEVVKKLDKLDSRLLNRFINICLYNVATETEQYAEVLSQLYDERHDYSLKEGTAFKLMTEHSNLLFLNRYKEFEAETAAAHFVLAHISFRLGSAYIPETVDIVRKCAEKTMHSPKYRAIRKANSTLTGVWPTFAVYGGELIQLPKAIVQRDIDIAVTKVFARIAYTKLLLNVTKPTHATTENATEYTTCQKPFDAVLHDLSIFGGKEVSICDINVSQLSKWSGAMSKILSPQGLCSIPNNFTGKLVLRNKTSAKELQEAGFMTFVTRTGKMMLVNPYHHWLKMPPLFCRPTRSRLLHWEIDEEEDALFPWCPLDDSAGIDMGNSYGECEYNGAVEGCQTDMPY